MEEIIQAIVKSYGLVGLILFLPTGGFVFVGREYLRLVEKMRKMQAEHAIQIDDLGKRVAAAQEKRVDDSHGVTSQLVAMISEHTAASQKTNLALDRIGDMVSMSMANQTAVAQAAAHQAMVVMAEAAAKR